MVASAFLYCGLVVAFIGLVLVAKPIERLGVRTRAQALMIVVGGLALATGAALAPAPESRVSPAQTRLDEFVPAWQFHERHATRVDAPPERVFEAMKRVRADEIRFFRTLTWIRRGGRRAPESILNAGDTASLIDVATRSGFVRLADEAPRELVIGTIVARPPGGRVPLTPAVYRQPLPPGYALGTMNFLITPDGGGSRVSTETRVFANSDAARRRFAIYWRVIYPGSAIIRRMWLRAIERRAEREAGA